ncbi:MAG: indolepyruvate ferredoxin oxidoreductase subunit alpha [Bacillota bacterium]
MKQLMTGNEAFALGAYMSGIKIGAGYPGTPSSEILMNFARYPGVYAEWSPNEKVALDVGAGAAYTGKRAVVTTKHVGLNVAADSLFYISYTGMKSGLVIINADDPEMHSSQNEQDNRYYAKFAKVPLLEPSNSQEAVEFVGLAVEISESFDTPVIVRSNTRLSHSKSLVEVPDAGQPEVSGAGGADEEDPRFERNIPKYVMVPGFARQRHPVVIDRLKRLSQFAETTMLNRIEPGTGKLGIITAGMAYQYAREVFPDATFLKLGMVYPLPVELIKRFASMVERVVVVEELEPFIEEHVRLIGIPVTGKEVFSSTGEFSPEKVRRSAFAAGLTDTPASGAVPQPSLPPRPPMLCPGCAHRGVFYALQRLRAVVIGDIGCYTLGALPPLSAMHTCGCMGASLGVVHGVDKAGIKDRTVGVIGDSTFFHSGIPPLVNILFNKGVSTVIILDNRITAMTGHQENPCTGRTLMKEPTGEINIENLVRAIGFEKVEVVDPFQFDNMLNVIKEHLDSDQPSVIIARHPCVLNIRERKAPPVVDLEACNQCGNCLRIGCSPISKIEEGVSIDPALCNGCGLCASVCPREAIITA